MIISDYSVRRPVFASVISLLLIILGLTAMQRLPVRQYPDADSPVVSIETSYRGASAEVVETKVTQVNSYSRENKHPLLCDMEEV